VKAPYLTWGDRLLVVLAVCALGMLIGYLYQPKTTATHIDVLHGSELLYRLSLSDDQLIAVQGSIGESVIEIHQGRARFIEAPCRQQICIHNGWVSHSGSLAACLPNRIAIRLTTLND
jgi:hypothetical protein